MMILKKCIYATTISTTEDFTRTVDMSDTIN